jgi:phosphonopyruvate decarboxylase
MGCASSLGLGLALAQPQRRVIVLDGDGAALMRLGALATIGYRQPPNLLHLLIDNEMHESTGGQATVSHSCDLGQVARACGYPCVHRAATTDELAEILGQTETARLTLVHVKVSPEKVEKLPRPTMPPWQVAARFSAWLQDAEPRTRAVG